MMTNEQKEILSGKLHLAQLVRKGAAVWGNAPAFYHKSSNESAWQAVSWHSFRRTVELTACAFSSFGLQEHDRIGILFHNHPACFYIDFAAFANRAVTVPLYATSSQIQVQQIVCNAGIRILFVGEQQQYDAAFRIFSLCPSLERIVIISPTVNINPSDSLSLYFDDFIGEKWDDKVLGMVQERTNRAQLDDLASILYTSGTTGVPKGVMLHHLNYRTAVEAHVEHLQWMVPDAVVLNYLPLAHVFERTWAYICLTLGVPIYINTNPQNILQALLEVRPTAMCCVPRFWEKIYHAVMEELEKSGGVKRKMMAHALRVGHIHNIDYLQHGRKPPVWLSMRYNLYERTVYRYLKKMIGLDRGLFFPTAGAAISKPVEEFVHSVDIGMITGYGLTESTATVSLFWRDDFLIGSVGRPLPSVQVKIGANNEILLQGDTITKGYYCNEYETKKAIDADGWFHTGDAGYFKEGNLFLTERIKDLFKTSNGKYIAPQSLESLLVVDRYIDQIVIIADNRKFVSALIVPNYVLLKEFAQKSGISYKSIEDLLQKSAIKELFNMHIDTLQQSFSSYEQIKRFALLPQPFSAERNELTQTLKVRRGVINENYHDIIESMYRE